MTPPGLSLARLLSARGVVQDPAWHRALLAVDRSAFVPDTVWVRSGADPGGYDLFTARPRTDPDVARWISEDYALMTQVDDGRPAGPGGSGIVPTSSISQPSLVVRMLEALDARDGDTVLEVGTGTGYNTALLCERFGDQSVTSIEVDPAVAEDARTRLHAAGYKPRLLVGEGADPPPGPYDHVLATVAARRVPPAWVAQTRSGGTIVTPWGPGFTSAALLRLEASEKAARGRMVGDAAFMWLRDQRQQVRPWREFVNENDPEAVTEFRALNPRVVADRSPGWGVVLGWLVPDLAYTAFEAAEDNVEAAGEATVYVYDRAGSWALAEYEPGGGPYETRRGGVRDLWGEITRARQVWCETGRPGRDRLGVTVGADGGHTLWVDRPEQAIAARPGP
ncbi:methyltransferase domain-containing protein [Streptomonospora litoralis]|uniref:Protein-L-isoaspartate O-methyltransferase n=1 Tax=Streptomonospora litoralis TaxID=2498135 RepID=A0A4P6Q7K4_9ACTN|nr:methyltransferase domain-containing protein [Streptomonospora litoralis]QBI56778.1 Protein-L-isoaspartate O-methyltransferase [Streptomonospora litoralis]